MKFLCVPCDSPMKLQTVGPPQGGSLSVVYSCPECGYEMAMLTNPYETQVVQSLGVRIGPEAGEATSSGASSKCPFTAMVPGKEGVDWQTRSLSAGPLPRKPGSPTSRRSSAPWLGPGSSIRPRKRGTRSGRADPRRGTRLLRDGFSPRPWIRPRFTRPYVISWNLTYRCNLACEHCYLDAGPKPLVGTDNFADRSELGTEECFRVIDEIAAFAPECLTILTGGEPLLRRDILEIVQRAAERELWVVVGTNGVRITENVARRLAEAGARGLSLSLDALDPERHDRFRNVRGAWQNTVDGAEILNRTGLPFIVQTTAGSHNLGELEAIADYAHDRLAARVWNLYFLVPTGRGQFVSDMTPEQYDQVLASLYRIQRKYAGRMLVNAKCAPHFIKTVLEQSGAGTSPSDAAGAPATAFDTAEGGAHGPVSPQSGPTPAAPAAARRARTTWESVRTATSPLAPTSRSLRGRCASRASRTCGRHRDCSATSPPNLARRAMRGL